MSNPMEKRQFGRRWTRVYGTISPPCRPPLACVVCEVSRMGALLEVDAHTWLPSRFKLAIGQFETDCEVKHRTSGRVGVAFDKAYVQV